MAAAAAAAPAPGTAVFMPAADSSAYATGPFAPIPRIAGVAAVSAGAAGAGPGAEGATLVRWVSKEEAKAAAAAGPGGALAGEDAEGEAVVVTYEGGRRVLLAVYGAKPTVPALRKAAVAAVNRARGLKVKHLELAELPAGAPAKAVSAVVQASALTNYTFDRYLTTEAKVPSHIASLHFVAPGADAAAAVAEAAAMAEGTIFARDIGNERADEMHPGRLEAVARDVAAATGMTVHTVTGAELEKEGLHLMHAVGQAARHAPRYVELHYAGDPSAPGDVIAVVGKGVTFDSGGLNIKSTGFMEDMHMDMCGAAAVLGAALTAARLGLRRNVVFVVGAVENAIDALAYKPHAIIRSKRGLTVEIGNTDAEGRLVLADALTHVQERHKPHTIIDLATLTGACIIALGEPLAGAFTNSKPLREALVAAGDARFERCWPMPILAEHRAELTGTPFADLKSTGEGRYGGACTAAAFLENFIGLPAAKGEKAAPKPAWCHLDIAGPASYSKDRGHMKKGATGFGVQLITEYLLRAPAAAAAVAHTADAADE